MVGVLSGARTRRFAPGYYQTNFEHPANLIIPLLPPRMVNNEVQFYEDNSFQAIAHKIHMAKVANYSMAQGSSKNLHVVTYVPGAKGAPSFTKMYQYPNFADTQVRLI